MILYQLQQGWAEFMQKHNVVPDYLLITATLHDQLQSELAEIRSMPECIRDVTIIEADNVPGWFYAKK